MSFENPNVFHKFFDRKGGLSTGIYEGLNCGQGSNDNQEDVQKNRQIVTQTAGVKPDHLLSLYQVHGDACLKVTEPFKERPKADAMVTDVPGLALSVLTADCAPVLFCDGGSVIGAAHAGWGGALKGILDSTVSAMEDLGASRENIHASIGPCIQKNSYEVSEEFLKPFMEEDDENDRFFQSTQKKGHFTFDLPGYCALKLSKAGLSQVLISREDTYADEARFFSYRRATHRGEEDYGRQISVIAIQEE